MLIHKSSSKNGGKITASKLLTHRFTAGCVAEFLQLLDFDSKLVKTTKKQENPVNTAQKMAIQSSTKQNGEATAEEVPGSIVPYTEEEINTFKEDMAPENTKKSTPLAIVLNRGT